MNKKLITLVKNLIDPSHRLEHAKILANELGAKNLIIFTKDPILNILLPASGFPQSLPGGRQWQKFISDCKKEKKITAELQCPYDKSITKVTGWLADDGSLLSLIGGNLNLELTEEVTYILPLIAPTFYSENVSLIAASQAQTEIASTKSSSELVQALSFSRGELQIALVEKEKQTIKIQESETLFRSFADSLPQLAWMAEADGFIFWYNKSWYSYTGTTHKEMEGWGWQSVHDPKILPEVMVRWPASIQSGKAFEMEFPLKSADGKYQWFLTRASPVLDSNGKIVKWVGTNTNIDDKIKEVESVSQTNKELDRFAAIAAHDLKAPLNSMTQFTELLADQYRGNLDSNADINRLYC